MLHAGLDLSRKKLDVCLLSDQGEHLDQLAVPPDVDSLRRLARRIEEVHCQPVCAVIESMTGARIVHDTLEQQGWSVQIADAQKVKGLAPLACKTDKIDSQVLAVLSHRDLVPAIWLPDRSVREERELARFRCTLSSQVGARRSTTIIVGKPARSPTYSEWRAAACGDSTLPEADGNDHRLHRADRRPRGATGRQHRADRPPLEGGARRAPLRPAALDGARTARSLPVTIAAEIGEIERFSSPRALATGYTGSIRRRASRIRGEGAEDH